ncbi:MAG: gamma-glutamyltransferase family protein [Pigmentiphaga sp.]
MLQASEVASAADQRVAAGRGGAVATAHSQATDAALAVLERGGNAMDAAICAAAMLGVVQPMMSGLGGDSFILWRDGIDGSVHAINGAGPVPKALTLQWLSRAGLECLPGRGLLSSAVPGAVDAMWLAFRRFGSGRFSMPELFEAAIIAAADGAIIAPVVGRFFALNEALLRVSATVRESWRCETEGLRTGALLRQPDLARTLDVVARHGPDGFYRGEFARRLVEFSRANEGAFELEDLAAYRAESVAPVAMRFGTTTVLSNPPVAQGVVLLEALGILQCLRGRGQSETAALRTHRMVEAFKMAFADRNGYFGDPRFVSNPLDEVLSVQHLRARSDEISDTNAIQAPPGLRWSFGEGDTTAFTVVDRQGNTVSFITSLSTPFGAAEIVPGTGVMLGNRAGRGFSVDPTSPNVLAAGKRTMSTLHAYVVVDDAGHLRAAGGTSGGDGQPQWNLQILDAVLNRGVEAHDAVAMARWELFPGSDPGSLGQPYEVRVDSRLDREILAGLRNRGHRISDKPIGLLGAAQMVVRNSDGMYGAAADPRADGSAGALN